MAGETPLYIVIPRWGEFQHYHKPYPAWIKNYTRQLADHRYLKLSLRLRGILHGLRLLYAESGCDLGASPAQLGLMLGDTSVRMRDLISLRDAGFIVICSRAEIEIEREREKRPIAAVAATPPPAVVNGKVNGKAHVPKEAPKPRARDPIWDTLVELLGAEAAGLERGRWNAACKSLRESGATPETLKAAAATYRSHPTFADCAMTPTALASNWTILTGAAKTPAQLENDRLRARIAAAEGGRT